MKGHDQERALTQWSSLESHMQTGNISDVFDHNANQDRLNILRDDVVDDVVFLHNKYPNFCKLTAAGLNLNDYARMRERYRGLHYGVFSLPGTRAVANELIWKWTEATGKYLGCQFWSMKAKELFDLEVHDSGGWPINGKLAKSLETKLSMKTRPSGSRLTHEHVYPIKDMKLWLGHQANPQRDDIRSHFERQCVSCVLLESEHPRRSAGNSENPWLRYKQAGIYLAPNPAWPVIQRILIVEAALLRNA